ncbi:MAG: hypothetical protein PVI81_09110 [Anaerolineales bacterium]
MNVNWKRTLTLALGVTVLISACGNLQMGIETRQVDSTQETEGRPSPTITSLPDEVRTPTTQEENPSPASSQRYTFDPLGISLEVPAELYVMKDPIVNMNDPSKLESYLFYIQNYGNPGGPNSGDFQMYGHLQLGTPVESWEQFSEVQNDTTNYAYVNYIEINGLRGFDAQFSGQRNRYVYMFYLDGHILSIAVSEPTPENKALSDQIISTLELTGTGLNDDSHVQMITDPQGYFQLFIPDDWSFKFNSTAGIRLSDLEASSPDAELVVEEQDGPHSNFYYRDGIFMNFVVLDDESAKSEPSMATIRSKRNVYLYGIEIDDYTFVEPSTIEGEIREFRFFHNGHSYLMRFAFPVGTDQEAIDLILKRLILTAR